MIPPPPITTLFPYTTLFRSSIAAAISEVLGRKIGYRPLTIRAYRERLEKFGLPEFLIQHFCAIAVDYQNGIFAGADRSEEHTSELQSLRHLVCRLLLEKQKR